MKTSSLSSIGYKSWIRSDFITDILEAKLLRLGVAVYPWGWRLQPYAPQFKCEWIIHFLNPLTAGAAYIRVFIFYYHIKYHILNMLKIKCDISQQDWKRVDPILSNLNNHSLEVVDRVADAIRNFKWVKIQIQ